MILVNKADLGSASFVSELNPLFRRAGRNIELFRNVGGILVRYSGYQQDSIEGLRTSLGLCVRYSNMDGVFWSEEFARLRALDSVDGFIENVYVSERAIEGVPESMRSCVDRVLSETVRMSLHPVGNLNSEDSK